MPICAQCSTENPEIARFCLACGAPLLAPEPPEEERKPVTVVFVDVVGSTSTAESLDPEDVQRRLDPYYRRLRAELERFGGTVEKFIGDAVVALFGAPVARGDDAERAVRAALSVLDAIDALNDEDPSRGLQVRVGVNTGEAYVALGARPSEGEGMAWGDVVNTAARLQSAAPPGGVLVGAETWRSTRRVVEYRERPPIEAKGKAEPVPVWEAVGVAAGAGPERPIVGREAELAQLDALWRQVLRERQAAFALVVGPPGIGKSRLVTELGRRAAADGAWVRGRCLPYGEGMTYWPVIEILKQVAGILRTDPIEEVSRKLGALLDSLPTDDPDELRTIAAAAANLLEAGATPRGTYTAEEISQAELHWGVRRLLELSAQDRPLLVVLEDLHWAEPTLLQLIRFVVEGAAAPLLLLGSARPELAPSGAGLRIELEPLSAAASEELLRALLGDAPADLVARADGNPLFLEELAGAFAEGGDVPTTLQALIGARLDALARGAKRVIQHAAVCGTVFWPGAVAVLTDSGDVEPPLEELRERELVREHPVSTVAGEREWSFKHVLIRDVAYGRLPKALRARLHERFAGWIAALAGGESFVEIRAWHLEQSCLLARGSPPTAEAVAALIAAGEKAERREGIREADRFYERALALLPAEGDEALELRFRRARLVSALGDHKAAAAALAPIAEQAMARGLDELRAAALVALANVELKQGRAAETRDQLAEARALAAGAGARSIAVRASYELAKLRSWFDGDTDGAVELLQEALAEGTHLRDRALQIEGHLRIGTTMLNAGRLAPAEQAFRRAAELAEELGSLRDQARAVHFLGLVLLYRSGPTIAERELLRADEWLKRTADAYVRVQNLRGLAKCALADDRPGVAVERLREALPLALEAGGWLAVETYRYLVDATLRVGKVDDAVLLLALLRTAAPEEDPYAQAARLVAEALVSNAVGEREAADYAFRSALENLERLGFGVDLAEARLAFAEFLEGPEASAQFALAAESLRAMGADALAGKASAAAVA